MKGGITMKKKRIVSALMAVAMCVSAMPVSVYAESDTTAEMPEFTQKFIDEVLLDPDESEENRLIHNYFKKDYNGETEIFLGLENTSEPYYLKYADKNATIPNHKDIKCVQYIWWDNHTSIYGYIENPYITEEEFNALSYSEKLLTTAKIYDETGENIAGMIKTALGSFPYCVGENGKAYNWNGDELDIFNGEVMNIYIQPREFEYDLYIYDGKTVYQYADVYDGDTDTALRADFYKYLEDNNCQQVFEKVTGFGNYRVYRTQNRIWYNYIEDIADELIITDWDGNEIPKKPNLLQVSCPQGCDILYIYKIDDKYLFEDESGNRIVLSEYDDSNENNFDDEKIVDDFFKNHSLYESLKNEELSTAHVIETYVAETDELRNYDKILIGDANEDGDISLADAVLIMQALSNPDEFSLTEQGAINADYNGDGSVTTADALEIQVFCIL